MAKKKLTTGDQVFIDNKHSVKYIRTLKNGDIEVEGWDQILVYPASRVSQ